MPDPATIRFPLFGLLDSRPCVSAPFNNKKGVRAPSSQQQLLFGFRSSDVLLHSLWRGATIHFACCGTIGLKTERCFCLFLFSGRCGPSLVPWFFLVCFLVFSVSLCFVLGCFAHIYTQLASFRLFPNHFVQNRVAGLMRAPPLLPHQQSPDVPTCVLRLHLPQLSIEPTQPNCRCEAI